MGLGGCALSELLPWRLGWVFRPSAVSGLGLDGTLGFLGDLGLLDLCWTFNIVY